jgi:hypothetical protein
VNGLLAVRLVGEGQRLLRGDRNHSAVLESIAWLYLTFFVIRVSGYVTCGDESRIVLDVCALLHFGQREGAVIAN